MGFFPQQPLILLIEDARYLMNIILENAQLALVVIPHIERIIPRADALQTCAQVAQAAVLPQGKHARAKR